MIKGKLKGVEPAQRMDKPQNYQFHLLKDHPILKETRGRTQKFKKIWSVLQSYQPPSSSSVCLDVGCSSGIITSLLGNHYSIAVGIDIDQEAVQYGKHHSSSANVYFLVADSMALPFKDKFIEVVICNHVYEHVPDPNQMMKEIYRILKDDGFCYFSAENKYVLIEGDYCLPFLSWLPRPFANLYLKLSGKGTIYYERNLSLRGLKTLVKDFIIVDYTIPIIHDPEKFFATDLLNRQSFLYKIVCWLAPYLYFLLPTYIWVLKKKA
jgi:SAM-dependent methyltransferase